MSNYTNLLNKIITTACGAAIFVGLTLLFWGEAVSGGVTHWPSVAGFFLAAAAGGFALFRLYNCESEIDATTAAIERLAEGDISGSGLDGKTPAGEALLRLSDYLQDKAETLQQMAKGEAPARIDMRSPNDSFGVVFQTVLEQTKNSAQFASGQDRLENSINRLLAEVSEIARGDLTVEVETGEEATAELANAFNHMTAELRSLIKQVKNVTLEVNSSADDIRSTTEALAEGSEKQAGKIAETSTAVEEMALRIQEVSANAVKSAKVAGESLIMAQHGTIAVQDNINAMNGIRSQVQETAKRIKRLGERSQEIGGIVQILDDLSEQTSLLALNASLQAAAAGQAGRGFVAVTEEVERLAERSNRAAQRIAALAQSIQMETKDVVSSMEETIGEVVAGSLLADKAGSALVEIERVANELADLIQMISESTRQQAHSSEAISRAMANISGVTEMVSSGSQKAAVSSKNLVSLSDTLRNSVAPFKLPGDRFNRPQTPLPQTTEELSNFN